MIQLDDKALKKIFWSIAALFFVYMAITVPQYGISGDGVTQYNYGTHVWNYIKTFGENKTVLTDEYILKKELQYYGGFFDGFAAMLIDIFHPKDEYLLRHYWCMLFGLLGIVATGLVAKEIGGWRAGILAMIFLFFTSRYLGESFNNPKDPPFAATYILALYAMIVWLKQLEDPKWKQTILLGLAIALCLSIRIGGLLLFAYLGLFYAFYAWRRKIIGSKIFTKTILHFAAVCAIGYVGAILWWPYALEAPLSNPLEALKVMSSYPLAVKMLFEGARIDSAQVPWYYLTEWLAIGLPLYLLIGFIGGGVLFYQMSKKFNSPYIWILLFTALFPLLYIIYKKAVLYDGLRHGLFIVPSMVVIAALFFIYLTNVIKQKAGRYAVLGVIAILVILPARFMFANQPNEYVYFNELSGGIKKAYGDYETDYYMNSIKGGYEWLEKNRLSKLNTKDTITIATNCVEPFFHYMRNAPVPIKVIYSRYYQKNQQDWDYGVYFGRFLDKEQLENGYFPSKMSIHNIEADGVPLCAVLANDPQRNGFKGYQAMTTGDLGNAVLYLEAASKKYPEDMEVWTNLALVYSNMKNAVAAKNAIDNARKISTLDLQTEMTAGEIFLRSNDANTASQVYGGLIENYPDMGEGYLGLAKAQAMQGNFELAIANVNTSNDMAVASQNGQLMKQGYMTLAYIYQAKGDMATAQRYYQESQKIQ